MSRLTDEIRLRRLRRLKKLGKRTIGFMLFFNVVIMTMVFVSVLIALFISEQINDLLNRTVGFTTPWFQVGFSVIISFALTFFIGWVIKKLVIKYGGTGVYNRARPFMIGLIAGEIFGAILPSIVAAIYYVVTNGEMPKAFHVLLS